MIRLVAPVSGSCSECGKLVRYRPPNWIDGSVYPYRHKTPAGAFCMGFQRLIGRF